MPLVPLRKVVGDQPYRQVRAGDVGVGEQLAEVGVVGRAVLGLNNDQAI